LAKSVDRREPMTLCQCHDLPAPRIDEDIRRGDQAAAK
jgi:hypothetical protein